MQGMIVRNKQLPHRSFLAVSYLSGSIHLAPAEGFRPPAERLSVGGSVEAFSLDEKTFHCT